MIRYNKELADTLKNDKTFIKMDGAPIQTKCIPDDQRNGYMDSREFAILKANTEKLKNMEQNILVSGTIEQRRNHMGFPNLNLNTIEILTKYEEHNFEGNKVKLWVYYPRRPIGKSGRPGLIFNHGGGFIGGSTFNTENFCKLLAERADCVVFNIDYSLAPEKPYPIGFNDCFHSLKYIYQNSEKYGVDKNKIGMGGDSAGGNLTAACAIKDRDLGLGMLKYQALIYPVVSIILSGIPDFQWNISDYTICEEQKSYIEQCLWLGRPNDKVESDDSLKLYLANNENPTNPYISPLFASSYKGICKTLVATAEFDGLRLQGEAYGKKLIKAEVDCRIVRYKGICHAFIDKLGILPQAEDLVQEIANDIATL